MAQRQAEDLRLAQEAEEAKIAANQKRLETTKVKACSTKYINNKFCSNVCVVFLLYMKPKPGETSHPCFI
jgi:hypothetical protein